ncbi:TetR/AcrR family transcriptional regulator [Tunturiibacter gelidiferens]|uniref:TetR/AcrR family transcriptional regulator n=1 Tax=Tunturiibacter gelidiferens TaxID=3069689 RepID=UPI003D9ABF92
MKQWSEDNPKAALMEQKRTAIVAAARRAFLDSGYAQTSMDGIAELAEVSVKTIYRHFENKDELFSAVMQAVCHDNGVAPGEQNVASLALRYPWFDDASVQGLTAGGKEYLDHVLSDEQLSLYRVVTRDAHRFPELGRRYQREVVSGRTEIFVKYIDRCARTNKWKVKSPRSAGNVFEALLRAGLFEEVLHGIRTCEKKDIVAHARLVANVMWKLMQVEVL